MFFISRDSSNFCFCRVESKQDVRGEEDVWQNTSISRRRKKGKFLQLQFNHIRKFRKWICPFEIWIRNSLPAKMKRGEGWHYCEGKWIIAEGYWIVTLPLQSITTKPLLYNSPLPPSLQFAFSERILYLLRWQQQEMYFWCISLDNPTWCRDIHYECICISIRHQCTFEI